MTLYSIYSLPQGISASDAMVVFDLDDTLYPEAQYVESGRDAVKHYIAELQSDADIDGKWSDEMLRVYREHKPTIALSADAHSALEFLRTKDIAIGIITDGRHTSQLNKFEALGLSEFVASANLIISEDIGADKTSDRPFCEMMQRNPTEEGWIYIADNPAKDFQRPNLLGWDTVMLLDLTGKNIHPQALPPDPAYHPKHTIRSIYDFLSDRFT